MRPQIIPPEMVKQVMNSLLTAAIGTELIYSFVIIVCSLMVYFGTKELYELSAHKGIKYFRQSFLFFAFAYFIKFFITMSLFFFQKSRILDLSPRLFGIVTQVVFMYTSTMAIFCLLYGVMWKKFKDTKIIYLFHFLALILSFITVFIREVQILIAIQILLFVFVIIMGYIANKNSDHKKKGHNLYFIYVLLFAFWMLNIIGMLIPAALGSFQIIIYLASIGIFLSILYRVLRKTGDS